MSLTFLLTFPPWEPSPTSQKLLYFLFLHTLRSLSLCLGFSVCLCMDETPEIFHTSLFFHRERPLEQNDACLYALWAHGRWLHALRCDTASQMLCRDHYITYTHTHTEPCLTGATKCNSLKHIQHRGKTHKVCITSLCNTSCFIQHTAPQRLLRKGRKERRKERIFIVIAQLKLYNEITG